MSQDKVPSADYFRVSGPAPGMLGILVEECSKFLGLERLSVAYFCVTTNLDAVDSWHFSPNHLDLSWDYRHGEARSTWPASNSHKLGGYYYPGQRLTT